MPPRAPKTLRTRSAAPRRAPAPAPRAGSLMSVPAPIPHAKPTAMLADLGSQPGYYRFPAIHGDQIAFCSDDDLWVADVAGGVARRLTVSKAAVARPAFSPDGRWIAFTGTDEGGVEVYLVPAEGGEPRRLTHLGTSTLTLGWSADGREVLCASDARQPFMGHHQLVGVPVDGGQPRWLELGPARDVTLEPGGPGLVIARNAGDPARWKRYRGGTAGTFWVDARGDGNFRQILANLAGNLAAPMWIARRLYFISDHEGVGNIYSCRMSGGDLRRHTEHADFYARFAKTDGRRIVYHAGADIRLFDPATGEARRVPVEIRSPRPQRRRKFVTAAEVFEDYDPHPKGHSLLLTVRGRPITMGFWEGPATEFGQPWRGRHRLARWLNDGKRIVAVSDEDGEERLEIFTPGAGGRTIDVGADLGRIITLQVAPPVPEAAAKGARRRRRRKARAQRKRAQPNRILVTNHRQEIFVVDLDQRRAQLIDKSDYDRIQGACWSPDGRWVAYGFGTGFRHVAIRIADAESGQAQQITSGDFIDFEPCFDPEGKYLYFLSLRTYDPVYDLVQFGLGFPRGVRPYVVTLRADETSPFLPAPRPLGAKKLGQAFGNNPWEIEAEEEAGAEKSAGRKKGKPGAVHVAIDFEGIATRVLAVPMSEGRYDALAAIPGKLFVRAQPIEGSLSANFFDTTPVAHASIEVYDFAELKQSTFVSGITGFRLAADGKTLVCQAGRRLRAVAATSEPAKLPSGDEVGRRTGWIDLSRARCEVQPADEWRQMVAEAWRLQRDQFWVPDLSKVDWVAIYGRYLPLVDRISTRGELSDLLWEMQGELGTSHCYEFGGDYRSAPQYPVGLLGADIVFDRRRNAWRVVHVPGGDSWDPKQSSPLAAPGLRVAPGTLIHEVNGRPLDANLSPAAALTHLAGQEVWLTISDPPRAAKRAKSNATGERRTISVKPLRSEHQLRYREWVESNRSWVHRQSRGAIGYVHIPNMGPVGYSEFHRYFLAEVGRPGLIVDVRHNGGGHVSSLVLDKLRRRRVGSTVTRHMGTQPFPLEAPAGPMVALTDELAGSDGDIFSHCWKLYGLGPLIGKRTWGGVVGIWPRHPLVDGSLTTQPEFSFWFDDVGWGVENYGTDPDIVVENRPQDYAVGRDPQLERGLTEATRLLRRFKPVTPDMTRRPSRALPRLPRRNG
jgi:tricorn protease